MKHQEEKRDILEQALNFVGVNRPFSRREFLVISGVAVFGMSVLGAKAGEKTPLVLMEKAEGIVIADPTKCVGCRRCELACTEFNDGKSAPSMARIKVARNANFGPKGVYAGQRGQGNWGNGMIVQDLCKQCPHPVPCSTACPNDAIVLEPKTNARMVDSAKCVGCQICQTACPWEMISFDPDTKKATKCFLCNGNPKCVEACPADALAYAAWTDLRDRAPVRAASMFTIPAAKASACADCHKK